MGPPLPAPPGAPDPQTRAARCGGGCRPKMATRTTIVLLVLSLTLLGSVTLREETRLTQELENAAHAPVFGIASLVLLSALKGNRKTRYLLAWTGAVVLGAAVEGLQAVTGRDAEALDILRDGAGAASFLLAHWTLRNGPATRALRWVLQALAAGILILVFMPPALTGMAIASRYLRYPLIEDFESRWTQRLCSAGTVGFHVIEAPGGFRKAGKDRVARITFEPAEYSGWGIEGPFPDWSSYHALVFEVYSELSEPVGMTLRIHDRSHNQEYRDRYNREFTIRPGVNQIRVPVGQIAGAPAGRRMDLADIHAVGMFVVRPEGSFVLYFDGFRLE